MDSIEGLSPAISIDQKTTSRNPRSTVGTVTEIYDYLRLLYARIGRPHCPVCGRPIAGQSIEAIVDQVLRLPEGTKFTVNAPVVRDRKGEYKDVFEELRADGFTRVKVDGEVRMLEEEIVLDKKFKHTIEVVVDRLVMKPDLRTRLCAVDRDRGRARRRPRRDRRARRRGAHVQRALRVPGARRRAARAPAAHLLVQLAARRLPALPRPRRPAGDRSRPARPRPDALDRTRARSSRGRRAARPSTRRSSRASPTSGRSTSTAVARPDRQGAGPLPLRHGRRADLRALPEPDGPQALVHARLRGDRQEPRAPVSRDGLVAAARANRGVHEPAALPGVRRGAPEARGARSHDRREQHPQVLEDVGHALDRVPRLARAERDRAADRRADHQGDSRAADVPRQRRGRLPAARPRGGRRSRAARLSGSGSRPRSARSSSASSTSSTSPRSASISATTGS